MDIDESLRRNSLCCAHSRGYFDCRFASEVPNRCASVPLWGNSAPVYEVVTLGAL